ncbi:transposase [Streptomyces sp. NPDC005708]|uniref:transposase n=1 Tax=unclassified Streptomyces TaxID=2593676 RepID=UPI0033F121DE
MIRRHELSDAEREFVGPLLPVSLRGRKRLDDRKVLNGIVWKFRTGTAWRDVPERYGPWPRCTPAFGGGRWTAPSSACRCAPECHAQACRQANGPRSSRRRCHPF